MLTKYTPLHTNLSHVITDHSSLELCYRENCLDRTEPNIFGFYFSLNHASNVEIRSLRIRGGMTRTTLYSPHITAHLTLNALQHAALVWLVWAMSIIECDSRFFSGAHFRIFVSKFVIIFFEEALVLRRLMYCRHTFIFAFEKQHFWKKSKLNLRWALCLLEQFSCLILQKCMFVKMLYANTKMII